MRIIFFEIFLLVFCAVCYVNCEQAQVSIDGDTNSQSSKIRSSSNNIKQTNDNGDDDDNDDDDDGESLISSSEYTDNKEKDLDREEVIKILRSPEFDHEKEAQKLSMLLYKFIKEQQPLDEIRVNKVTEQMARDDVDEPVLIEQTPEEIERDISYESAMKIMNKARGDKEAGSAILLKLAKEGHIKSEAQIAWYRLLNDPNESITDEVRKTFERLAGNGLPEAHMVRNLIIFL